VNSLSVELMKRDEHGESIPRLPKWFISYDISPKATKERPGDRR
jgi:hypothetical protein